MRVVAFFVLFLITTGALLFKTYDVKTTIVVATFVIITAMALMINLAIKEIKENDQATNHPHHP